MDNLWNLANSANNGAKEMEFGSSGSGKDREHNLVGVVAIPSVCAKQDECFYEMPPFDKVSIIDCFFVYLSGVIHAALFCQINVPA